MEAHLETMFDFHTHILPNVDDGSQSVAESLAMLAELTRQGVSGVAATPHYYAHCSSPDRFFEARQDAWNRLKPNLPPETPEIRLGAEVQYFEGIHRLRELEQFRLEGTNLLLIEMPMCKWTDRMQSCILEINRQDTITVLLAHIERYMRYQNAKVLDKLQSEGVLMQASASFFIEKHRTALKLFRKGRIHLLGSDAHNMTQRAPNLGDALEIIGRDKKLLLLRELEEREGVVLYEKENDSIHV